MFTLLTPHLCLVCIKQHFLQIALQSATAHLLAVAGGVVKSVLGDAAADVQDGSSSGSSMLGSSVSASGKVEEFSCGQYSGDEQQTEAILVSLDSRCVATC